MKKSKDINKSDKTSEDSQPVSEMQISEEDKKEDQKTCKKP